MIKKVTRVMPAESSPSAIHLYSINDPIPVPEAIELDSDAAWALWEASLSSQSSVPDANLKSVTPDKFEPSPLGDSPEHHH